MYTCQSQSPSSSHHHPPIHFPPLVSIHVFSTSVSLFLPCKKVHLYHFSRFHMYALIYHICFSLSDLLHSVWQSLDLSMSLQRPNFIPFYASQLINTQGPHGDGSFNFYGVIKCDFCPEPFWTNEDTRDSISLILSTVKIRLAVQLLPRIWSSDGKTTRVSAVSTDETIVLFYIFIVTETCSMCCGKMKIKFLST